MSPFFLPASLRDSVFALRDEQGLTLTDVYTQALQAWCAAQTGGAFVAKPAAVPSPELTREDMERYRDKRTGLVGYKRMWRERLAKRSAAATDDFC